MRKNAKGCTPKRRDELAEVRDSRAVALRAQTAAADLLRKADALLELRVVVCPRARARGRREFDLELMRHIRED